MMKYKYERNILYFILYIIFFFNYNKIIAEEDDAKQLQEPNYEIAKTWWPTLKTIWTPIGWKNHLFRFNVLFNGTIVMEPTGYAMYPRSDFKPFEGLGVQLTFIPSMDGEIPQPPFFAPPTDYYYLTDPCGNRFGDQGLENHPTPVVWTRWKQHDWPFRATVLKEQAFSRIYNATELETGTEPLFCWIRFSLEDQQELYSIPNWGFLIRIDSPHLNFEMLNYFNLKAIPQLAPYKRKLSAKEIEGKNKPGLLIGEEDGRVRMAVLPDQCKSVRFIEKPRPGKDYYLGKDYYVFVEMEPTIGSYFDLLVPAIPLEPSDFQTELAVGYDRALEESDRYWSNIPETAANFHVPEKKIEEAIKTNFKYAQIIANKSPKTGEYCVLTASLVYPNLCANQGMMTLYMLLDNYGYQDVVEQYLKPLKNAQGSIKNSSDAYKWHPGYLCSPRNLNWLDHMPDHGAILHTMAYHALLTDNQKFINEYLDTIVKGCEFILDAREWETHNGVKGILPPAISCDRNYLEQAVWSDGWNYKGLMTSIRLLKRIGHPRASEFEKRAEDYRLTFIKALREKTSTMPVWTDNEGKKHHLLPVSLSGKNDMYHPFYLDAGPLQLVFGGLLDADDELMRSCLKYFRNGPNLRNFNPYGHNINQPPVLIHEISSCEPGLSWSFFHSHQLRDRYHYLEGMYSLFAGAISDQTYISSETIGGISGLLYCNVAAYLARLSVIDDYIKPDELHLLRLVPKAWLRTDEETVFKGMPTEYGPIDLSFKLDNNGRTLKVSFLHKYHHPPQKVIIYIPPIKGIKKLILNGKTYSVKPSDELII